MRIRCLFGIHRWYPLFESFHGYVRRTGTYCVDCNRVHYW